MIQLNPKKDENGLLRSDGRLRNATDVPYGVRHSILLPKDHTVTRLIIISAHENLGHGSGVEHVLTELRARFWIIKGRRTVRNTIEKCPGCRRRFTGKPTTQMMAPLPMSRLQCPLRAFERVGVDYGGPYLTKQGRGKTRAKRYLCLFTCLTTRAIHLEMAYSLDTDSFINAFTRMVARRGKPTYVVSDNGAERELRELVEAFDQEKIANKTTQDYAIRAANYCRTSDNVRLNLANVRAKVILIGHWSDKKNCHIIHFFAVTKSYCKFTQLICILQ